MKNLTASYKRHKKNIKKRLKEFKNKYKDNDKDIFAELCFCILTPQSKAVHCDIAIKKLKKNNLLLKGSVNKIKSILRGFSRFHNKKASYIVYARKQFLKKKTLKVKKRLEENNIINARNWIVKNIKGIGMKEASHFLRNIGMGKDIAILDVHILRNLKRLGIIKNIPKSISVKTYLDIEDKMRKLANKVSIPMEELDLLFWSRETGFIFK